ncbi:TraB/GumN family protein [Sphingomonas sp. NSE70-1]|uniref:TraB/GumN family protein n=1 Tax=Sphingomonas caseinilyticus TaxID=2908205 RepID=A0ABT0RSC2_9SPHN|nr:TraB/GumN family protein [Sphingomonas caseinilyticus]MCL6697899.1 TraB/GumN family protein [Sphingomonas caseinilyticus]
MSLLKRFGRRLLAVSAVAATACSAAPATEAKAANPALWKVADHDTTIYLFGTIHLLPKNTNWRSSAFDKAAAGADTLVVETVIDESNPAATMNELLQLAVSPGLPPLAQRVPADKRPALQELIAKSGIPAPMFDRLETWAAAFMLLGVQFKELGLDPGSGVESALKKQFTDGKKTIGQLETNAEQLGFFDRLSEEAQRKFLVAMLDGGGDMNTEFKGMLDAWTRGDVKGIAKSFNSDLSDAAELRDALLTQRNANWAKWVKGRLDQPGTVLVAVGAGHLAGEQSVQTMLEKQGVKVTRVQ